MTLVDPPYPIPSEPHRSPAPLRHRPPAQPKSAAIAFPHPAHATEGAVPQIPLAVNPFRLLQPRSKMPGLDWRNAVLPEHCDSVLAAASNSTNLSRSARRLHALWNGRPRAHPESSAPRPANRTASGCVWGRYPVSTCSRTARRKTCRLPSQCLGHCHVGVHRQPCGEAPSYR